MTEQIRLGDDTRPRPGDRVRVIYPAGMASPVEGTWEWYPLDGAVRQDDGILLILRNSTHKDIEIIERGEEASQEARQ
jgi:hypothetical protein